jgi:molybdopterin synthase sulfur carrier subunit
MIQIRYFASLRERVGTGAEAIDAGDAPTTVAAIAERLRGRGGAWNEALGPGANVLTAVNQEMAQPDSPVEDGDEVAFFPPVTGG